MMDNIKKLRVDIDNIDEKIIRLLKQRSRISRRIGEIKAANNSPVISRDRENDIFTNLKKYSEELDMDESLIKDIWKIIIKLSYKIQNDVKK